MKKQITIETISHDEYNQLFPIEAFIPSTRTIVEARLTNIEQRAQQLMNFVNTIDDTNFF
jgi:hypothetical protein